MAIAYNVGLNKAGPPNWASLDVRVLLLSAVTPNKDHATLSAVLAAATEYVGANYVRKALVNEAVVQDDVNDWVYCDADDVVWTALGPASGGPALVGALVYVHVSNDTTSYPVALHDLSGTPNGTNATLTWPADGIVKFRQGA